MKVSAPVKAPQRIAHKKRAEAAEKSKPATLKSTRVRHPRIRLLPTKGNARMIYSLGVFEEEIVKKSLRHPPFGRLRLFTECSQRKRIEHQLWPVFHVLVFQSDSGCIPEQY